MFGATNQDLAFESIRSRGFPKGRVSVYEWLMRQKMKTTHDGCI